jgi:PAS domain S-box-containing protein
MRPELKLLEDPEDTRWKSGERLLAMGAFLAVVVILTLVCAACVAVLAAARAFGNAESLYSKGQKNAVIHLQDYIARGSEVDYAEAAKALAVPLAAREAHLLLNEPRLDDARARAALLRAGNDARDIRGMVMLSRLLRDTPWAEGTTRTWTAADDAIVELDMLATTIHASISTTESLTGEERLALDAHLHALNEKLDRLELSFAAQLAAGAHWIQVALIVATLVLAIFLTVTRLVFVRAMSERLERTREWISERNMRWALAAQAGNLGLLDWRPDVDTIMLDARACAIFGLDRPPAGLLPASALRALVVDEDRSALADATRAAVVELAAVSRRFRIRRPDGELRHVELNARAFARTVDRRTHMIGLVRDVTSDVAAETARLEEAAVQRTHEMKSHFLSQVSHELRTPLNAVLGFSKLMRDDRREPLTPAQAARLGHVIDGGDYLLRLVNDLLDRASMEQGQLSVAMSTVRLRTVLEGVVTLLEPARAARRLAISLAPPPADLCVHADPVRLKQVLVNVLSNAIKYNRAEGAIALRCEAAGEFVAVVVADEGAGLTAHQRQELFVPFRRLGAEATVPEGAGLGLVISRYLVERQGGTLELESTPGQGTTVTVRLRLAARAEPAWVEPGVAPHAPAPHAPAGTVLYIEDDPVNVLLIEEYLRPLEQVALVVAADGASGLARARECRPDLVLLDMQLPDMDGLAVLQALKADGATAALRVVALSASAMADQRADALALGVEDYWTKPISCEKLRGEVVNYLH